MTKAKKHKIEKFTEADLAGLREELMKSGLDSWQAADLISSFLAGRGHGVDRAPRDLTAQPTPGNLPAPPD